MIRIFMLAALSLGVLAGCQTTATSKLAGTTPVTLSKSATISFQRYRDSGVGRAFAITQKGYGGSSVSCEFTRCSSRGGSAAQQAVKNCESAGRGPCKIFAIRNEIVWKGPVTYPEWPQNEYPLLLQYTYKKTTRKTVTLIGKAIFNNEKTSAELEIYKDGNYCPGAADLKKETWKLDCGVSKKYSGSISPSSKSMFWGQSDDKTLKISILDIPKNKMTSTTNAKMALTTTSRVTDGKPAMERSLYGSWEGVAENLTGSFISDRTARKGRISVLFNNPEVRCSGQWLYAKGKYNTATLPQGTWSVVCENGMTAGGTYTSKSPTHGAIEGEDAKGRKLELFFKT